MSLSKQMVLILSIMFLLIFSINILLSVKNSRDYLQGEANIQAQNTAVSLGLSLAPHMQNEQDPVLETMIQAVFDRSYFHKISLKNNQQKTLVEVNNALNPYITPQWFVDLVPIKLDSAVHEISHQWKIAGTLTVTLHPGYAYQRLYQLAKNTLYYSALTFLIAVMLMLLTVRLTFKSLKNLEKLAENMANSQFTTVKKLPLTTEVRTLTLIMNSMSAKISQTIQNLNKRMNEIGEKLHKDDLTGLYKYSVFETDIKKLYAEKHNAFLIKLKVDCLTVLAKEHNSKQVDNFLQKLAEMLLAESLQHGPKKVRVYRFYGGEFALLVKKIQLNALHDLAEKLRSELIQLGKQYQIIDVAHMGIAPFNALINTDKLLEAADEAYEQAQRIGVNSYAVKMDVRQSRDVESWKKMIFDCIDHRRYQIQYDKSINHIKNNTLLMEEALIVVKDDNNHSLPMATFFSIAEKFAKIVELEKHLLEIIIELVQQHHVDHMIAVNLSTRTVKNKAFHDWLERKLKHSPAYSKQIVFCVTAYAVAKDMESYQNFIQFAHKLGAKVMIKRFETQSMSIKMCRNLQPDYIRLSIELARDIANDEHKQICVGTLVETGSILNMSVFAESVGSDEDLETLKMIGINGYHR